MLQAHEGVLLYTELLFLISTKNFTCGLVLSYKYNIRKITIFNFLVLFIFHRCLLISCSFIISQVIIKLKTNKIGVNKTFFYTR